MQTIKDVGPNLKSFFYHACEPSDEGLVRGSVIVLHGAEGHGGRYGAFGDELVKNGYAMYSIDHIGHGLTIMEDEDNLGKWSKDDFYLSTYNVYYLVDVIKRKHPGKPVYLLGHDYGGTMAQYMMGKYDNAFDGIIISSCGMPTSRDKLVFLTSWFKKVCLYDGAQSKGTFRSRTAFLNSHFRPTRTKYDWLNSVDSEVDRFIADPLSGFVGTIGYYYYQYKYIVCTPRIVKLKKVKRDLPIMLIGGADDYISHRGKQIEKLKRFYEHKGFTNVVCNIYAGARHDVLLEWNKDKVAEDIAAFIDENSCVVTNFVDDREKVVEKKETIENKYTVVTLKELTDGSIKSYTEEVKPDFKEEEPDDDLRLSNELKK